MASCTAHSKSACLGSCSVTSRPSYLTWRDTRQHKPRVELLEREGEVRLFDGQRGRVGGAAGKREELRGPLPSTPAPPLTPRAAPSLQPRVGHVHPADVLIHATQQASWIAARSRCCGQEQGMELTFHTST
jgi:hypothetical protein